MTSKDRKKPFDDEEAVKILSTLAKQRKEAADLYMQGDRPELAKKELDELTVIQEYLPKAMSEEDIRIAIKYCLGGDPNDTVGGMIKKIQKLASIDGLIVDGKLLSTIVKEMLAK